MRSSALALRLSAVVILAFALRATMRMTTSGAKSDKIAELSDEDKEKFAKEKEWYKLHGSADIPVFPNEEENLMRFDPLDGRLHENIARGWPSVGGFIVAETVHPVELEYLQLDRFQRTPRSLNATEEDKFCRRLRLVGGKWWKSYWDYDSARILRRRKLYIDEKEILYLGWPRNGGVWLLRYQAPLRIADDLNNGIPIGIIYNALNMEERCKAIEICGGTYFEKPEDSEFVRLLVEGFGKRESRRELDFDEGDEPEGWLA